MSAVRPTPTLSPPPLHDCPLLADGSASNTVRHASRGIIRRGGAGRESGWGGASSARSGPVRPYPRERRLSLTTERSEEPGGRGEDDSPDLADGPLTGVDGGREPTSSGDRTPRPREGGEERDGGDRRMEGGNGAGVSRRLDVSREVGSVQRKLED